MLSSKDITAYATGLTTGTICVWVYNYLTQKELSKKNKASGTSFADTKRSQCTQTKRTRTTERDVQAQPTMKSKEQQTVWLKGPTISTQTLSVKDSTKSTQTTSAKVLNKLTQTIDLRDSNSSQTISVKEATKSTQTLSVSGSSKLTQTIHVEDSNSLQTTSVNGQTQSTQMLSKRESIKSTQTLIKRESIKSTQPLIQRETIKATQTLSVKGQIKSTQTMGVKGTSKSSQTTSTNSSTKSTQTKKVKLVNASTPTGKKSENDLAQNDVSTASSRWTCNYEFYSCRGSINDLVVEPSQHYVKETEEAWGEVEDEMEANDDPLSQSSEIYGSYGSNEPCFNDMEMLSQQSFLSFGGDYDDFV